MCDSKEKHVRLQCNLQHVTYQLGQDEDHLHYQPLIYATLRLFKITNKRTPIQSIITSLTLKQGVLSLGDLPASNCVQSKWTVNSNQMYTLLLCYTEQVWETHLFSIAFLLKYQCNSDAWAIPHMEYKCICDWSTLHAHGSKRWKFTFFFFHWFSILHFPLFWVVTRNF